MSAQVTVPITKDAAQAAVARWLDSVPPESRAKALADLIQRVRWQIEQGGAPV